MIPADGARDIAAAAGPGKQDIKKSLCLYLVEVFGDFSSYYRLPRIRQAADMDTGTTSLVIGLSTVLASGVASALVTYRLNRAKEQTFFMRAKAEELYLAVHEFGLDLSSYMVTFFGVTRNEITYNQMLDIHLANPSKKKHGGIEKLTMLARIYFPELRPELERLFEARNEFNSLSAKHKAAYKAGDTDGTRWHPQFTHAIENASTAIDKLEEAVVASARRYSNR